MFCKNCGKQIDDDAKFCEHCRAVINDKAETVDKRTTNMQNLDSEYTPSVKRKAHILIVGIIAIPVILVIAICLLIHIIDNKNFQKAKKKYRRFRIHILNFFLR